jgi:hypothetical protein
VHDATLAPLNSLTPGARVETVPPDRTPRDEMDDLLDHLVTFARQMLDKHGEFYPFGATISSAGELHAAAGASDYEHPDSVAVLGVLEAGFREQALRGGGDIRASALCADVVVGPQDGEPTDAIQVAIEHIEAEPVIVRLPYKKRRRRGVDYGELLAEPGTRKVFASSTD